MVACVFLVELVLCSSAFYAFSLGHVYRASVLRNVPLTLIYLSILALALSLIWTSPNELNCLFRVNCDNDHSLAMTRPMLRIRKV